MVYYLMSKSKKPIPRHAKKVFSGKIFDVYQWQQTMYDGSKLTYEKVKRLPTVGIFPVTSEGKIILTKQSQAGIGSFISAIGGKVERHQSVKEAGKVELLEEAGMSAKNWKLWFKQETPGKYVWDIYNYIVKDFQKTTQPTPEAGEIIELFEVTFDEFIDIALNDNRFRDFEVTHKILRVVYEEKVEELREEFLG